MKQLLCMAFLLVLVSCHDKPVASESGFPALTTILGGADTAGYLRAELPRTFSFPQDHALHPGYRNEWWYLTGNLETASGRRFGYQVTWFYTALPPQDAPAASSGWASRRLWMAHLALTDVAGNKHYALERFSRENPGLAGASLDPFHVWLEDWQLKGTGNEFPWQLSAPGQDFGFSLSVDSAKAPVLQGEDGLSRKSSEPGNASYYYSMTRLPTSGTVQIGTATFAVSGNSWLDREWSTSALAADQSGWDWFSLQFSDGRELMYYRLRTLSGQADQASAGNLTDSAGNQHRISPEEIELVPLESWNSPSGTAYDTAWSLRYGGQQWRVEAVLRDQWMNLSIAYWEGAVDIRNPDGSLAGQGYLEMVR